MESKDITIEKAHRTGSKINGKKRAFIVKFLNYKVKEFWYLLKRIFLRKFEKTLLNLMNLKKYFLWKFCIKIPPIYFRVTTKSHPRVTMIF